MSTVVYVINQNGNPLMPCKPSKARKLLRDGRARVKHRSPFTLQFSAMVIEDVQVDIARLNNPTLKGSQYQDPTRLDENLRIACLMRDGYRCQHCSKQHV